MGTQSSTPETSQIGYLLTEALNLMPGEVAFESGSSSTGTACLAHNSHGERSVCISTRRREVGRCAEASFFSFARRREAGVGLMRLAAAYPAWLRRAGLARRRRVHARESKCPRNSCSGLPGDVGPHNGTAAPGMNFVPSLPAF